MSLSQSSYSPRESLGEGPRNPVQGLHAGGRAMKISRDASLPLTIVQP